MIEILRAPPLLTVQDRGRFGFRHAGVSSAGSMDAPSFALANALVGNDPTAAGMEFAFGGGIFRAASPCRIAVTGGTPSLHIDEEPRNAGQSHRMAAGQILRVGVMDDAVWGYLAISGGVVTAPLLGSRATHLRTGLGSVLERGERVPLGPSAPYGPTYALAHPLPDRDPDRPIRVVLGPQADRFGTPMVERFLTTPFKIGSLRDRMAMTLNGPTIRAANGHDIVSDGTVMGSVQVPGSGQPLILMAESQTTGGYPKIATVIGADLPRLAQMPTGRAVRFQAVDRDMAESLWIAHARAVRKTLSTLRRTWARA